MLLKSKLKSNEDLISTLESIDLKDSVWIIFQAIRYNDLIFDNTLNQIY